MWKYKFLIGTVTLLPLVSLGSSQVSINRQFNPSSGYLALNAYLAPSNIGQLATQTTYYMQIDLGEAFIYKKTILSKGEPRVLGTWNICKGTTTVPGATGIAEFTIGPKNELTINLQQGVSNRKTILTLSKPNFEPKDFEGAGILFVGSLSNRLKGEAQKALEEKGKTAPERELLQQLVKQLDTPDKVGMFRFLDENFFKSFDGLDFIRLVKVRRTK